MKTLLYKILTNKYLWLLLFVMQDVILWAHDCSSPGDCEETAGYNAAVAITGGAIAVAVGIMSSGMIPPDTLTDYPDEVPPPPPPGQDVSDEELEDFIDDIGLNDEDEEVYVDFDDDDFDDDIITDKDIADLFGDDEKPEVVEPEPKEDIKQKIEPQPKPEEKQEVHKSAHDAVSLANAARTLLEEGAKKWISIKKKEELAKAVSSFYDKIKNLKAKGLKNLITKYADKLNHKLLWKAKVKNLLRFKKYEKAMDRAGKLGDGLDILVSVDKVWHTKGDGWDKTGKAAEETLRFIIKKGVTKVPGVGTAIGILDAVSSMAGGPNMDTAIDAGLDTYKKGVTKTTEWLYTPAKTDDQKFMEVLKQRKEKINKMKLSHEEKRKRIKKIYRILRKNEALWK